MIDDSIYIQMNEMHQAIDNWNNFLNTFNSNLPLTNNTSSEGFNLLRDAGFVTDSFNNYNNSVNQLSDYLVNYYNIIKNYVESMDNADNHLNETVPKAPLISTYESKKDNLNEEKYVAMIDNTNLNNVGNGLNKNEQTHSVAIDSNYNGLEKQELNNINTNASENVKFANDLFDVNKVNINQMNNYNVGNAQYEDNLSNIEKTNIEQMNNNNVGNAQYEDNLSNIEKTNIEQMNSNSSHGFNIDEIGSNINMVKLSNINNGNITNGINYDTIYDKMISIKNMNNELNNNPYFNRISNIPNTMNKGNITNVTGKMFDILKNFGMNLIRNRINNK